MIACVNWNDIRNEAPHHPTLCGQPAEILWAQANLPRDIQPDDSDRPRSSEDLCSGMWIANHVGFSHWCDVARAVFKAEGTSHDDDPPNMPVQVGIVQQSQRQIGQPSDANECDLTGIGPGEI